MWEVARSEFDVIKISNVKLFVHFIFVHAVRHHTKYTKICTNLKFHAIRYIMVYIMFYYIFSAVLKLILYLTDRNVIFEV